MYRTIYGVSVRRGEAPAVFYEAQADALMAAKAFAEGGAEPAEHVRRIDYVTDENARKQEGVSFFTPGVRTVPSSMTKEGESN